MKRSDFEINYASKKCTLDDIFKYHKNPKDCKDLEKISVIVYFSKEVDDIEMDKEYCVSDYIMNLFYEHELIHLFAKIVILLKLDDFSEEILNVLSEEDKDEQYDLFYKYITKTLKLD